MTKGIDAQVEDMEEEGEKVYYYVDPKSFFQAKTALENQGIKLDSAEIIYAPATYVNQDEETQSKILNLVNKLEELDDVQKVYTNLG